MKCFACSRPPLGYPLSAIPLLRSGLPFFGTVYGRPAAVFHDSSFGQSSTAWSHETRLRLVSKWTIHDRMSTHVTSHEVTTMSKACALPFHKHVSLPGPVYINPPPLQGPFCTTSFSSTSSHHSLLLILNPPTNQPHCTTYILQRYISPFRHTIHIHTLRRSHDRRTPRHGRR